MSTLILRPVRPLRPADLFSASPSSTGPARPALLPAAPSVVLERDGEDGVLVVEVPGLDAARDLSVEVTGTRLTVAGTRRQTSGRTRREVRFSRSVVLPEGVGADAVGAAYEAGVLRVRVAGMFPAPVVPETVRVAITTDVPAVPAAEGTDQADQADRADRADRSDRADDADQA